MGLLSQNTNDINNELSSILRIIRSYYKNEIKLQITNVNCIQEFKLKIFRKNYGAYKFLFLIKIPKEYPFEPFRIEPVIVSREMMTQFYHQDYKFYKIRPLIDELIVFCQKYDNQTLHPLQIWFPVTNMYGEKETTANIFFLLNKTLTKIKNRDPLDISNLKTNKELISHQVPQGNDYYNDMGLSMINYIGMLNKISMGSKKFDNILLPKSTEKSLPREKSLLQHKLLISRSNEIRRHISKTLYSKLTKRTLKKFYVEHLKDVNYCKMNLSEIKKLVDPLMEMKKTLTELDFLEEFSVDLEESFRFTLQIFDHVLSMRQDVSNQFTNIIELSSTLTENQPDNMKIPIFEAKRILDVVPMHSREIIPVNYINYLTVQIIKIVLYIKQMEEKQRTEAARLEEERKCKSLMLPESLFFYFFNFPDSLVVYEQFEGLLTENIEFPEYNFNYLSTFLIKKTTCYKNRTQTKEILNDGIFVKQPFLKDRIAQQLMLREDHTSTGSDNIPPQLKSQQTRLYSEIISEVIQFPKSKASLIEYTLELNPRSSRHRTILDCIGLLKYKHYSQLEILAPNDYNLRLFFIKEIFNPNGRGVIIKLHKLSPENLLYQLVLEENNYFKSLSATNKSVWCTEITSSFNLDLFKLIFDLGKMYFQKLERKKKMKIEATTLNCSDLTIQRYHFPKDIIESLSIFDKSL